jgi:uncharacterized membrane protein YbhN (UPF0104 family)
VARVIALTVASNWLGYASVAGVVFLSGMVHLPPSWHAGEHVLRAIGVLLLAFAVGYLLLCAYSVRRSFTLRAHTLILPSLRMALLQLALSCANWMIEAGIVYLLLGQQAPYFLVLGVLLVGAIAALIAHIPAGLGALEAVFVALLGGLLPSGKIIAALLAYRALYYLAPLLLAVPTYFWIAAKGRKFGAD